MMNVRRMAMIALYEHCDEPNVIYKVVLELGPRVIFRVTADILIRWSIISNVFIPTPS